MAGEYNTVVIGGGAAGICAAINLARAGGSVVICEKTVQIGKKILASGDGRCNLLNEDMSEKYYNPVARELVKSVFTSYGKTDILDFFKGLGVLTYSRDGRIFPVTNQASSVLKVLEIELKRLAVPIVFNFDCTEISYKKGSFLVTSKSGKTVGCRQVIITGGGKSYPAFGSDGSTLEMAKQCGHRIIEPVPSVVPLVVKDSLCTMLQGQRITASASSVIDGKYGEAASGELLFTKYGLSGTCILDVSEAISIAINRNSKTKVAVAVDMVPFMNIEQLEKELTRRIKSYVPEDMTAGILPNKFGPAIKSIFTKHDIDTAVKLLKNRQFEVTGTRGWNEAEFTSGGVAVDEVKPGTLESKLKPGVYFAGEVLDVNGRRGGYNLGWAWASGFAAGQAIIESIC